MAFQDSIRKRDYKMSSEWDLILENKGGNNDIKVTGLDNNILETFAQVIDFCLKTKIDEYGKQTSFGASPRGIKTKMIQSSINDLKNYMRENLKKSGINPNSYPIDIKSFPIGRESLAINVTVLVPNMQGGNALSIIFTFNESTQTLRTIKAFGV